MHDTITTRYYKFLIVNVLVFFCVGTATLQSFLTSFKTVSGSGILNTVADSFPTAGPFYVGWRKYSPSMSCSELMLLACSDLYHCNSWRL
jgi:hypothetical protein